MRRSMTAVIRGTPYFFFKLATLAKTDSPPVGTLAN